MRLTILLSLAVSFATGFWSPQSKASEVVQSYSRETEYRRYTRREAVHRAPPRPRRVYNARTIAKRPVYVRRSLQARTRYAPRQRRVAAVYRAVAAPPKPVVHYSGPVSCGERHMAAVAKSFVAKTYGDRAWSWGNCGGAVGDIVLTAGYPFSKGDSRVFNGHEAARIAITYPSMLEHYGWVRLPVTSADEAPPGSVLVFNGPCSTGYAHPEGTFGCGRYAAAGNRSGHVTIKGDPDQDGGQQWYYTDARQSEPAMAHRYLAAVYVPGPELNKLCDEPVEGGM